MEEQLKQLQETVETLQSQLAEKDAKINELVQHNKDKSFQFKKLRDMTEREKELLSEQEMKLKEEQDALFDQMEAFKAEQKTIQEKQRSERIDILANKYAKGDKELANQIKIRMAQFKGFDEAMTETELETFATDATRIVAPDVDVASVREAHNTGGRIAETGTEKDFVDTEEGSKVYQQMFGEAPTVEAKKE